MTKKRKITNSLTFKVLCGLVVVVVLAMAYNFIVNSGSDNKKAEEEEQLRAEQVKAEKDTIDIVGDYLWPNSTRNKNVPEVTDIEEFSSKDEAAKKAAETKNKVEKTSSDAAHRDPIPAPAHDAVPPAVPQVSNKNDVAPVIEKIETPKVEKID